MQKIALQDIYLKDLELINAQQNTVDYLLSLDANRFLYEFYQTAHLNPITQEGYQGWERSDEINFRGHFFGHYLTALSQAIVESHQIDVQNELLAQLTIAINGLAYVQTHYEGNPGYISAFREAALDEVEGYEVKPEHRENVLVPWYNLDKVLAGLVATHLNLSEIDQDLSKRALEIGYLFGLYVYNRMQRLPDCKRLLTIEYGAMNATLYDLFSLTKDSRHFEAATYFDELDLFEELANNHDVLAQKHANTTIPKFLGALKHYQAVAALTTNQKKNLNLDPSVIEHNEMYLKATLNFWEIVVQHHTYVTGGNSQSEHFHEADQLYYDSEYRQGDCTCETCNTYNMLRLSRELFNVTKDKKYLDYIEKTYINAILASQHPDTGMMMYFQPMGVGYNKVYNRPYNEFWCCTGTGIESFTKLSESLFFYDNKTQTLLMNLYFSNTYLLRQHNLSLETVVDRLSGKVRIQVKKLDVNQSTQVLRLKLRLPNWTRHQSLKLNGRLQALSDVEYWVANINVGDRIDFDWKYQLVISPANDNPSYVAFTYGPYVLSSRLGKDKLDDFHPNGILVRVGTQEKNYQNYLTLKEGHSFEAVRLADYRLVHSDERLFEIELSSIEENLRFAPYYQAHNERYGIYYEIVSQKEKYQELALRKNNHAGLSITDMDQQAKTLVQLRLFDGNNSEYSYHLKHHKSQVGVEAGQTYRQANPSGSFSYQFNLNDLSDSKNLNDSNGKIRIILTLHQSDSERRLNCEIAADTLTTEIITPNNNLSASPWYEHEIEVNVNLSEILKITFSADDQHPSARLFGLELRKMNELE